jgi:hypothetical protein
MYINTPSLNNTTGTQHNDLDLYSGCTHSTIGQAACFHYVFNGLPQSPKVNTRRGH